MDTPRFILAIVLMIAVIIVTNILFPPAPPPEPEIEAPIAEEPVVPTEPPVVAPPVDAPPAVAPPPPDAPLVAADTVLVETPLFRFGFSTLGAAVVSAELLQFESFTRPGPEALPVQLVEPDLGPLVRYRVEFPDREIPLDSLAFAVQERDDTLSFRHTDPETGLDIELNYAWSEDSYLLDVWGRVGPVGVTPPYLLVELGPTLRVNERNPAEDERALSYVVNGRREGIRSVRLDAVQGQRIEDGPLVWVAVKNKYFLTAALSPFDEPARQFGGAIARELPLPNAAAVTATLPADREGRFAYQLYVGPQEYDRLVAVGRDLHDVNPYGWAIFRPVIRPLAHLVTWALVGLQRILDIGYGWVLIIFGVLIRVVLWPLNARAMRSQLKNMELQPRMKEIQEKYRKDPEQLQKEMLRLYKEEGFNPLGGCLPMLIPFPVLITLFFVFQSTIEFRGVEFLWLPDLSQRDPAFVLPVLLGASMFAMQWLSMRSAPAINPQMKMMLWFLPGLMVIIFANLASGLNLYYLSMNVASIPQQLQLVRERRRMQARMPATQPAPQEAKPEPEPARREKPPRPRTGEGAGPPRRRRTRPRRR